MDALADTAEPAPTASGLIADGATALAAAGVSTARLDAEVLLATACGIDRTALYARGRQPVTVAAGQAFAAFLRRRLRREPLQYIVGRQEFWSLDFVVTPDVLVPRPETELLVELVLSLLPPVNLPSPSAPLFQRGGSEETGHPSICDLGTGSGCLAVALACELPSARIVAVDQSAAALAVARENAQRLGAEQIRFVEGDLLAPLADERFDFIVCNPPYIASAVLEQLQPELAWEPHGALDGGADGLDCIRRVIPAAAAQLVSGGWLLMEIGADQGAAVLALAQAAGLRDASVRADYAGLSRVLSARR